MLVISIVLYQFTPYYYFSGHFHIHGRFFVYSAGHGRLVFRCWGLDSGSNPGRSTRGLKNTLFLAHFSFLYTTIFINIQILSIPCRFFHIKTISKQTVKALDLTSTQFKVTVATYASFLNMCRFHPEISQTHT